MKDTLQQVCTLQLGGAASRRQIAAVQHAAGSLVTYQENQSLRLWDLADGTLRATLLEEDSNTDLTSLNAQHNALVSIHRREVRIWDAERATLRHRVPMTGSTSFLHGALIVAGREKITTYGNLRSSRERQHHRRIDWLQARRQTVHRSGDAIHSFNDELRKMLLARSGIGFPAIRNILATCDSFMGGLLVSASLKYLVSDAAMGNQLATYVNGVHLGLWALYGLKVWGQPERFVVRQAEAAHLEVRDARQQMLLAVALALAGLTETATAALSAPYGLPWWSAALLGHNMSALVRRGRAREHAQ
ncbi:MAG: hypothetical protein EOO40_00670 [Deltaproteobacteria bacterium]|nr:MAG: hypothetical protein EOO40_00670 [Deltaproteobacteria bacterium]